MYHEPEGVFEMSYEEIFNEYDGKMSDPGDEQTCELPPTKFDIKGLPKATKEAPSKQRDNDYRPRCLWLVMYQWIEGAPMQIDAAPITGPWKTLETGQAKQFALDELAIEWEIEENTEVLVEIVVAYSREDALMTDGDAEEMWVSV